MGMRLVAGLLLVLLFNAAPASADTRLPVPAWLFPQEGDLPQGPYNRCV